MNPINQVDPLQMFSCCHTWCKHTLSLRFCIEVAVQTMKVHMENSLSLCLQCVYSVLMTIPYVRILTPPHYIRTVHALWQPGGGRSKHSLSLIFISNLPSLFMACSPLPNVSTSIAAHNQGNVFQHKPLALFFKINFSESLWSRWGWWVWSILWLGWRLTAYLHMTHTHTHAGL